MKLFNVVKVLLCQISEIGFFGVKVHFVNDLVTLALNFDIRSILLWPSLRCDFSFLI